MLKRPSFRVLRVGIGASLLAGSLAAVLSVLATTTPASAQPNPPVGAVIVNNGSYADQGALPSGCASATYTTIQSAVTGAAADSIVYVCAGTYDESVTVSQPLTLDGAEFGVDAVGRSGEPETIIDSTGGISYATGATTGTISGFDMSGYSGGGTGEIDANPGLAGVGSAWTFTDNIIDASEGGIGLNTDNISSPGATTIADNEFTQSTPANEYGSGWAGQAITFWGDSANNVSINHNDFLNLSGPGGAINTTGSSCATSSAGLSVADNTFEGDGNPGSASLPAGGENFVVLFCTTDASVTGNTSTITDANDPNAETPIFLGGGNVNPVVSGNTLIGDGATDAAGIDVDTGFYPSDNATLSDNSISGYGLQGIIVYAGYSLFFGGSTDANAAPSGFTIEGNSLTDNGASGAPIGDGILLYNDGATYDGNPNYPSDGTISGNYVHGSTTNDCEDQSSGGAGTDGTDNSWSDNIGATSSPDSPTALCGQVPSGVTTAVDDASTNAAWVGNETTGASAYDTSGVTGELDDVAPTGTVSYSIFDTSDCSSAATGAGSGLALGTHSTAQGPLTAGSYGFEATYSGDSNYTGSTSACEAFTVGMAAGGVTTAVDDASNNSAWTGSEATGSSAYDTSSVTGERASIVPTGTVSYTYFTNSGCSAGGASAGSDLSLGSHSSSEGPLPAGSYGFEATYSGDSNYTGATGTCESFSVGKGSSPTKTTPTDSTIVLTLNQSDTDQATVTGNVGGGSPTGTVSYYECGPTTEPTPCTSMANPVGSPVALSPGANDASTATSARFTPNAVGYWCFASYYSGDSNYNTSSDATVDECVNVEGNLTIITTSLPGATVGQPYSVAIVARGGTQPFRWSHTGRMPRGISLNRTTGVLSGTPHFARTFTIHVRVKDSSHPHQIVTQTLTLVIGS